MRVQTCKYIFLMVLMSLVFSCSSKQSPINDLEQLCVDLEKHSRDFSENDWKEVQAKMEVIDDALSNYDYSASEKQYIDKLKGKYLGYLVKVKVLKTIKFIEELPSKIPSATQGFLEVLIDEN